MGGHGMDEDQCLAIFQREAPKIVKGMMNKFGGFIERIADRIDTMEPEEPGSAEAQAGALTARRSASAYVRDCGKVFREEIENLSPEDEG
jgi:hypothetical protein